MLIRQFVMLGNTSKYMIITISKIPSQTTITMLKDYCDPDEYEEGKTMPNINEYQPMIDVCEKVDRLVDIMNGCSYKSGKDRDVEFINTPRHRHINKLFDVVPIFEEWQKESIGNAKQ